MHSTQPMGFTLFHAMADIQAKTTYRSWPEIEAMLTAPHASALSHKSNLPLFSPWAYKDVADPTVVKGNDADGKPLKFFSRTHVRRIKENLVEMTMLVLDYDGGSPLDQLIKIFSKWEHVGYTTLNHREEGKDKARIVLPLATSMSVADFEQLAEVIKAWATDLGADPSTADIGRMFILPAVREEHRHLAQSWHHKGPFLDWRMFRDMPTPVVVPKIAAVNPFNRQGRLRKLLPGGVIETANGHIAVRDITRKISNVRCPFHTDPEPSEFVNITARGTPFLVCKRCGTVYMERAKSDGIVDGIAQILAKKKQREGGV
ncbi:hypothetical protein HH213_14930 [Duganella dendranthematis]|uniref:Uncharacterized protein n=1 Tax=Duganella dendranthematis TaxID=2728021 RepID=A0ABX6MAA1_9BURK|nr:hypothetical protein [Duganella dendranthematis]QJD91252.1 hypothetical protein HH213_14930 [Duganella dendranthematis]